MPRKRVGQILRLNLTIPLWLMISIAAFILILTFILWQQKREHIKFVAAVIGGSAAIYSAYYVGAALRIGIDRNRQEATFQLLDLVSTPEYVKVRNFLEKEVEDHENQSPTDLYKRISGNADLDDAITLVFNTFERIAIAIRYDVVDENILHEDLVYVVRNNYNALRGYIDQLRKVKNSPLYFCEFEKLATSWQKGKRLSDGRPLSNLPAD